MLFKSKAQERWMFENKPEMAKEFAKHTDQKRLPEHVKLTRKPVLTHKKKKNG